MAINKDGNGYTIVFSVVMCVLVGTILAVAATWLKPYQDKNIENKKKQSILAAIKVEVERDVAETEFDKYVKGAVLLDATGKVIDTTMKKSFDVNVLSEYKDKKEEERVYPLFICEKEGKKLFVMPVAGMGLWAGVWGYVSVGEDFNTVIGASFGHKSETPGLGAEIETSFFEDQFQGKKILDETGNFVSVRVVKPGTPKSDHNVDGISGGTFTSKGVDEMLNRCLNIYSIYFKTLGTSTANIN